VVVGREEAVPVVGQAVEALEAGLEVAAVLVALVGVHPQAPRLAAQAVRRGVEGSSLGPGAPGWVVRPERCRVG
jgi:hypothetical protein